MLTTMSSEINQTIQTYLYRERARKSSSLVRKGVSIGVGELASWVFESSKAGRYGRNLTKQYLDLQIKERARAYMTTHVSAIIQREKSIVENPDYLSLSNIVCKLKKQPF
jgi:hypothetical protein